MPRKPDSAWLCIGGANVDVKAESAQALTMGTSNPGVIRTTCGGVARNIAENLARLGRTARLHALVGSDADGAMLIEKTRESGVDTSGVQPLAGHRTGRYLSLHDHEGEMVAAVADMEIMEAWDEARIESIVPLLAASSGVFLDTNLPPDAFERLLHESRKRGGLLAIDPVSVKKAEKCRNHLADVTLLTPNCDEAAVLTGINGRRKEDVEAMGKELVGQGVKQVMITWGANGVYLCNREQACWLSAPRVTVRDVTGAGDAFTAGVMYGLHETDEPLQQAAYGMAMAALTLMSPTSVAETVTPEKLKVTKEAYLHEHNHQA